MSRFWLRRHPAKAVNRAGAVPEASKFQGLPLLQGAGNLRPADQAPPGLLPRRAPLAGLQPERLRQGLQQVGAVSLHEAALRGVVQPEAV